MANAAAFLAKAEESLASASADLEAGRHNSCARSTYYACFQAAVAALIAEGLTPGGKWSHEYVQGEFSGRLVYRRKRFNTRYRSLLQVLFRLRSAADYSEETTPRTDVARLLAEARDLVKAVKELVDGNR